MSVKTGHFCPHCEEYELVIDWDEGGDTPNGPGSFHSPGGFVVRCPGSTSGECNGPDITGKCETEYEALKFTEECLNDWKPYLVNLTRKE